jgi:hypothetical protein
MLYWNIHVHLYFYNYHCLFRDVREKKISEAKEFLLLSLEGDLKKNVLSNLTYWVDCDSNWYYVSLHRNLVCKSTGISQWSNIPGRFVIIVPFLIVGSENWRQFNNHDFIRDYQKKKFDDINEFKIVCNPSDTLDVMTKFTWDSFVENMI